MPSRGSTHYIYIYTNSSVPGARRHSQGCLHESPRRIRWQLSAAPPCVFSSHRHQHAPRNSSDSHRRTLRYRSASMWKFSSLKHMLSPAKYVQVLILSARWKKDNLEEFVNLQWIYGQGPSTSSCQSEVTKSLGQDSYIQYTENYNQLCCFPLSSTEILNILSCCFPFSKLFSSVSPLSLASLGAGAGSCFELW